tara:strand:+ start:864 stop:1097 length:234 start_codon:yes stop_codon:yes gene_type:complete
MALVLAAVTGTTTFSYFLYNYINTSTETEEDNIDSLNESIHEKKNIIINDSCIISETLTPNNMNIIPKNKIITIKEI